MTDDALLAGELSLWSAVLLGQGETDWANLLDKAANLIKRRETDSATSDSLRLYAIIVSQKDQASFQTLIERAAETLFPGTPHS
jgi:hypothetical protein